jgi:hypothetical protein
VEYGKQKDIFVGSKPLNPSNKPFYSCKFDSKTLYPASYESQKLFYCCNVETTTINIITAVMLRSGLSTKLLCLTRGKGSDTVDLLIKVGCSVTRVNNILNLKTR